MKEWGKRQGRPEECWLTCTVIRSSQQGLLCWLKGGVWLRILAGRVGRRGVEVAKERKRSKRRLHPDLEKVS